MKTDEPHLLRKELDVDQDGKRRQPEQGVRASFKASRRPLTLTNHWEKRTRGQGTTRRYCLERGKRLSQLGENFEKRQSKGGLGRVTKKNPG